MKNATLAKPKETPEDTLKTWIQFYEHKHPLDENTRQKTDNWYEDVEGEVIKVYEKRSWLEKALGIKNKPKLKGYIIQPAKIPKEGHAIAGYHRTEFGSVPPGSERLEQKVIEIDGHLTTKYFFPLKD